MGVPKFFFYISERYPCLSELAREQCIPTFDNLYLDMNGIIHNCTHPDDTNIHFSLTEEEMFKDIFNYIDKLFFLIKPQRLFFMAVDGVAPRAKMNQQRSRRFRSAREAELLESAASRRGEVRTSERFDSNCITPGTEFMVRLHDALQYFIKKKISSDPLWQHCRVILSGHNSPGEGEHKIMDYIRHLKSQPNYDPNTRHCLYGLDADLVILGMCTHELHFVVLREEVKFGKKVKHTSVEQTRFFLLHLGLLREYLEMEFDDLKKIDPNFDVANLIDDWVLMGFMVGNDFIPHLPCLHISLNALPLLYKTYMKVYPELGGCINEHGKLNLERLEKFFEALSAVEFELFQESYADLKYFEAKKSKGGIDEAFDFDVADMANEPMDEDLSALVESSKQYLDIEDDEDLSDEEQHIEYEFQAYKRNYYMNKLKQESDSDEVKHEQAICYITALQWNLDYYYCGVQSWDWYYPHHYAPFISDIKGFKNHKIKFNMGKPFLPFEQLLAVLPAASKDLLPAAYRDLMTNSNSELIHFYPTEFESDLNGKKQEWEAVVLIPFIDEKLLLKAMKKCEADLSVCERQRNRHGPMMLYEYTDTSQGFLQGMLGLHDLRQVYCTEKLFYSEEIAVSAAKSVCVELPNAARTCFFPGFPSMKHLNYKFKINTARVRVFDRPSRKDSIILLPQSRQNCEEIHAVAQQFLNQEVYVGWPHLVKAKVVAISNEEMQISGDGIKKMDKRAFTLSVKAAEEHTSTRMGIEFPDYNVMVHVNIHIGSSYVCGNQGRVHKNEIWSNGETVYPAQGVIKDISEFGSTTAFRKIEQLFPADCKIFFTGNPYYGSEGTVINPNTVYECGRLKVNLIAEPEPNFDEARFVQNTMDSEYLNQYHTASAVGINQRCCNRITGTILVIPGEKQKLEHEEEINKTNIGLQLKFPNKLEERVGYARFVNGTWHFSQKAIDLLITYYKKYPEVFDYLSRSSERGVLCFESDIFPNNIGEKRIEEIAAWLKEQDHISAERVTSGAKILIKDSVQKVLDAVEALKVQPVRNVKLQVKPYLLLKPDVTLPNVYKPTRPIQLFDRVVVVKTTYMVAVGHKGTVIGIYPVSDPNPVRLECVKVVENFLTVLFDKIIPNAGDIYDIAHERIYRVPATSVLLLSVNDKSNELNKPPQASNRNANINQKIETKNESFNSATTAGTTFAQQTNNNNNDKKPTTADEHFWLPAPQSIKPKVRSVMPSKKQSTANMPNERSTKVDILTNQVQDIKMENEMDKVKDNQPTVSHVDHSMTCSPKEFRPLNFSKSLSLTAHPPRSLSKLWVITPPLDKPPIISRTQTPEEPCEPGTLALKNLLGISKNRDRQPEFSQSLGLLPDPPANWRGNATNAPTQSEQPNPSAKVRDIRPYRPKPIFNTTLALPIECYYDGERIVPLKYLPPVPNRKRDFSAKSLSLEGAFAPLQAVEGSSNSNALRTDNAMCTTTNGTTAGTTSKKAQMDGVLLNPHYSNSRTSINSASGWISNTVPSNTTDNIHHNESENSRNLPSLNNWRSTTDSSNPANKSFHSESGNSNHLASSNNWRSTTGPFNPADNSYHTKSGNSNHLASSNNWRSTTGPSNPADNPTDNWSRPRRKTPRIAAKFDNNN